jgi:hypothetical protein
MLYRVAAVLAFLGIQLSTVCAENSGVKQSSASFAEFDRKAQAGEMTSIKRICMADTQLPKE